MIVFIIACLKKPEYMYIILKNKKKSGRPSYREPPDNDFAA